MDFYNFLIEKNNILCFSAIAITTLIIELSIKKNRLSFFTGRKLLHVIAITICAYCIYKTHHKIYLSYLFLAFSILLGILVYKKAFASSNHQSYGIALFPLAFFILLQLPFLHIHTIVFSVLTLAFSDAAAGYIGFTYGKKKIVFLFEGKSWIGFVSFYIVTFLLFLTYFGLALPYLGLLVALFPALVELFSYKGSDNFSVPILTALWLYLLQVTENSILYQNSFYAGILLLLALIAYRKKWLTVSGSTAAFLVGVVVVFFKDVQHLIPLAVFFLCGTLATKLNDTKKPSLGRNAFQVFANGIIAIILLMIYYFTQKPVFYTAFFASIAISMTDTLSSEIGRYCKQPTYDITSFKKTKIGLSGGVSMAGTLAGLLGVVFYGITIYCGFQLTIYLVIVICFIGFAGMLVDSILGSVLQAKYKDKSGSIVEEKNQHLVKGYAWCTNDMVNLMSNCIVVIFYFILSEMILKQL